MAQKRSSNAAQSKKKGAGGGAGGAGLRAASAAPAAAPEPLMEEGTARDLLAVGLAVVAVVSLIAVVAPSTAPVTAAIASFYHAGFGLGAFVLPLLLLAFAVLLFLRSGFPVRARSVCGGVIVFVGILALLALFVQTGVAGPGASEDMARSTFFGYAHLAASGGYVGCTLAYALRSAFGTAIAAVVLVGLVVAGLVVLGLSIGDLVQGLRERVEELVDRRRVPVNDTPWGEAVPVPQPAGRPQQAQGQLFDAAETAFLGSRMTTVLDREAGVDYGEDPFVDVTAQIPADEAKTTLLPFAEGARADGVSPQDSGSFPLMDAVLSDDEEEPAAPSRPASRASKAKPSKSVGSERPSRAPASNKTDKPDQAEPGETDADVVVPDFLRKAASEAVEAQEKIARQAPEGTGNAVVRGVKRAARAAASAVVGLPPMSLLKSNPQTASSTVDRQELEQTAASLQSTLAEFNLQARVVGLIAGPTVTTYKVQMGEGERVSKIQNLEDDIALSLAAEAVRIFAPIPGTSLVGVEVPNRTRQNVSLGDVLPYAKGGPLELAIGRDVEGAPVIADLAKMPHLLIAGSTGSGKSVMINAILSSILMRAVPDDVRLIMVDPKRVELSGYNGLPHLYVPVVTEPKQAASALSWGVAEMERRLKIFERLNVRNIGTFNKKQAAGAYESYDNPPDKMPYLVIIIDELSDLMMVAGKDVEASIVRIAQLGRAAGIHLIVATQRPSSDVVTGLIKANIINRIAFKVATGIDSRVIIDQVGAEKLIGLGDMLFSKVDWGKPKRIQGCFVSDEEIAQIVAFWKEQGDPEYHEEILSAVSPAMGTAASGGGHEAGEDDPLVWEAAQIVVDSGLGSTSGLQRRLKVGYARAGRIMDMLEEKGVVGPPDGSKPREVLLDAEGLEELMRVEQRMDDA